MNKERIKGRIVYWLGLVLGRRFRVLWWDQHNGAWHWGFWRMFEEVPNRPPKTYSGLTYGEFVESADRMFKSMENSRLENLRRTMP